MRIIVLAVVASLAACSGGEGGQSTADTLTRRERDSIIGESNLPGAGGVRGALKASDSATARRALEDSLSRQPD
ncbi:MAG: hypothetical protein JSW43_02945 [Gemmatimonadota bacterium]|nr:MAG: hypothetical protein JSW43_02945 [Gemmatimonadota bacterium]